MDEIDRNSASFVAEHSDKDRKDFAQLALKTFCRSLSFKASTKRYLEQDFEMVDYLLQSYKGCGIKEAFNKEFNDSLE